MKMILYVLITVLCVAVFFTVLAFVHMMVKFPAKKTAWQPPLADDRGYRYADKLSRMIRCNTVSVPGINETDGIPAFHLLLEELFPLLHQKLEKTDLHGNLLFYWKGRSSERPMVLMSHQDTVPARDGEWTYGPFSGTVADGRVWGRGACDTKCSLMGFLQAVEELLEEGYLPEQDVYLSSSCTEEWEGGGCREIVDELDRRGVHPFLVCDEGGGIMPDPLPGIRGSFAMIGVLEKGNASVRFSAYSQGGHGSTPFPHSPIPRLAEFVRHIEHRDPFRKRMPPAVRHMLEAVAPYGILPVRFAFSNLWLFGGLIAHLAPRFSPRAGAMLQSTLAFTMQEGSDAWNVIPQSAWVGANIRSIPHQNMEESLEAVRKVSLRYGLEMTVLHSEDTTPGTDLKGDAWKLVTQTIKEVFPGVGVSPFILTGGTDARFYERICEHVLRFAPVVMGPEEKKGIHAADESISVSCLPGCVDFYKQLIKANRISSAAKEVL